MAELRFDPKQQPSKLSRVVKVLFCVVLFALSLANIFVLIFPVLEFAQLFHDFLGGKRLPLVTNFIIDYRWALVALDMVPALTSLLLCRLALTGRGIMVLRLFMVAALFQIIITVVALFLPLVMPSGGMSSG